MFRLKVFILSLTKKMWPKVSGFAVLAVISAILAYFFRDLVPDSFSQIVSRDTISTILSILASSMLAVTTFSLSTMVAAYASSANATPRATGLVMEDRTTQNALATFLGSFVFSLVGIISLNLEIYQGKGRFILFIMTLVVVVLILVTLIRWIDHLRNLGRIAHTTGLVEEEALKSLTARAQKPYLGCNRLNKLPLNLHPVMPSCYAYVKYIDIKALSAVADQHKINIYIRALPGTFTDRNTPIAALSDKVDVKTENAVRNAFITGSRRSYEQDPRFGLCVMSEIADKALSSGINDPGTAIDVIGRLVRLLAAYTENYIEKEADYKRLWVPPLTANDMFSDAFNSISRDGAGIFEVQVRLQKAYASLYRAGESYKKAALQFSKTALKRAENEGLLEQEMEILRKVAPTNG